MKVNINLGILVWIMHGEPIPFTKNQHAKTAFVVFLGATVVYLDFFKLNVKTKTFLWRLGRKNGQESPCANTY